MRRVALALAVVGLVGLMANIAVASPPSHGGSVQMVGHHGYGTRGSHYFGFRGYGGWPGYDHGYGHRGPVIVRPMPHHPTIVYPFPGHPPVVHPPVHSSYRYRYYSPSRGFYYRGRGFGFSISF